MLYEFEQGHNAMEAINIICIESDGTVDHCTVTRWFKKFYQAHYLTNQHSSSSSQLWQKHLKLPSCASHDQNIVKLLTHPNKMTYIEVKSDVRYLYKEYSKSIEIEAKFTMIKISHEGNINLLQNRLLGTQHTFQ